MDVLLAFLHAFALLVWASGAAVLGLILLAGLGGGGTARRATVEAGTIGRRVLHPASMLALLGAVPPVSAAGTGPAAWAAALALALASLAARPSLLGPALARAGGAPGRALRLAALDLAAHGGAIALLVLRPGAGEVALLAGLAACLALACALGPLPRTPPAPG